MTRNLFALSFGLFIFMVALIILGFSSATVGSVALAFLCIMPLAFMALGAALSRFTSEFEISRKGATRSSNKQTGVRGGAPGQVIS